MDVLHDQEHETAVYHAIQAIGRIGELAASAVPALMDILRQANADAQGAEVLHALGAARALGEIGDPAALPVLKECVGMADDDGLVEMLKEAATESLAKISG